MDPDIKIRFKAEIDPLIHPEDAFAAVVSKLLKKRSGGSVDPITNGVDLLLDTLVNQRDSLSEEQRITLEKWKENPEFARRFKRGVWEGRHLPFSRAELFVLRGWRKTHEHEGHVTELPGLREWSPAAAGELMLHLHLLMGDKDPQSAFTKVWKRLGLKTTKRKKITGFVALPDGRIRLMEPGDPISGG